MTWWEKGIAFVLGAWLCQSMGALTGIISGNLARMSATLDRIEAVLRQHDETREWLKRIDEGRK